jgi:hypothetical protein
LIKNLDTHLHRHLVRSENIKKFIPPKVPLYPELDVLVNQKPALTVALTAIAMGKNKNNWDVKSCRADAGDMLLATLACLSPAALERLSNLMGWRNSGFRLASYHGEWEQEDGMLRFYTVYDWMFLGGLMQKIDIGREHPYFFLLRDCEGAMENLVDIPETPKRAIMVFVGEPKKQNGRMGATFFLPGSSKPYIYAAELDRALETFQF